MQLRRSLVAGFVLQTERLGPLPLINHFLERARRIEALFTLYFLALLVQALIEREPRLAMQRELIAQLPLYPEQRLCKLPTTEQILRLFSLAERHTLCKATRTVQVFPAELTAPQRQILDLLGVPP